MVILPHPPKFTAIRVIYFARFSVHYYSFNIGDYASHTQRLSKLEDLAYRRLLDLYYLVERPLNGCTTSVARDIGMVEDLDSIEYVLNRYFVLNDEGLWTNSRADKEIRKYRVQINQHSKAGKASGKARRVAASERSLNSRSTAVEPTNNQEPITSNQEPINKNHKPRTNNQKPKDLKTKQDQNPPDGKTPPARKNGKRAPKSAETWESYKTAYFDRYGADPIRNAKTNALLCQLVDQLGAEEAPHVAASYLRNNSQFYVLKGHPINLLVVDAQKLRTEWATGNSVTSTRARQIDKTQSNFDAIEEAKQILRAKDEQIQSG